MISAAVSFRVLIATIHTEWANSTVFHRGLNEIIGFNVLYVAARFKCQDLFVARLVVRRAGLSAEK
jgi:hypothetical protein